MGETGGELLRRYIRCALVEDGGEGLAAAGGPYGVHYASADQMYTIFIKPFADVFGVAAGKTKELSQRGQTLLKVAFESIATSLLPILRDSYAEIFAKEKQALERIRSQYADVYQATWDAFKDEDILIAAFMYRPDLFVGAKFAKDAPRAAAKVLSVLSGGALDQVLSRALSAAKGRPLVRATGPSMAESLLREDSTSPGEAIARVATDNKVRALLARSPRVRELGAVGKKLLSRTLGEVLAQARVIAASRTIDDIQRHIGKRIPGAEKLDAVPKEQRAAAEASLLATVKRAMGEFYAKQLAAHAAEAVRAGVPEDHPYVLAYINASRKVATTA